MKNFRTVFTAFILSAITLAVHGQSKTVAEYFEGKWSVLLKGTPDGDARMFFVLEKKADSLGGVVQDSSGKELSKISKIEQKENEITVYFTAQGYDVNIVLTKKDDDHATGNLMGMFDVDAERKKEDKPKK